MFNTAGGEAQETLHLLIALTAVAAVVWVAVVALTLYAGNSHAWRPSNRGGNLLVLGGGVVLPLVVLGGFLIYSLPLTSTLRQGGDEPVIHISGERFWWRITYSHDGRAIETANELRLPVGRRSNLALTSPDVIHSFWVPSLAGKLDVVPGRTNRMSIEPKRVGRFRGQCAEFCGASHAYMAFSVVVMEPDAYEDWLQAQAQPAAPPETETAQRGRGVFLAQGCGACHAVRGTPARGRVGPDLTHLATRRTIAAETLPNEPRPLRDWVEDPAHFKPEVTMPAYAMLDDRQMDDLVAYLESLQ